MDQESRDSLQIVLLIKELTQEERSRLVIYHPNNDFSGPTYAMDLVLDEFLSDEVVLETRQDSYLHCLFDLRKQKEELHR